MKDDLLQLLAGEAPLARANLAREYLQLFLLRLLQDEGALASLALVGGTALRVLHRLPRFSEDLDFCAEGRALKPREVFEGAAKAAVRAGYQVELKAKPEKTVANAFLRFRGLPKLGGWSSDPRIALSIKLEIDLRPPAGAGIETTLVQRFFPVAVRHHDLPSLFAGKLHAALARKYAKGRDWFDLVWYLTEKRGLEPNETLLRNALKQTGHELPAGGWRQGVEKRLARLDWKRVVADLRPFVERQADLDVITKEHLSKLLTGS